MFADLIKDRWQLRSYQCGPLQQNRLPAVAGRDGDGLGRLFLAALVAEEFNLACPGMERYPVVHQVDSINDFPLL